MKKFDLGPVTPYALAVKNGFEGTEQEWLASLKGDIGVASAQVGQIIKVKAVDDAGKPTEWEAVDMPTETIGGDTLTWDGNTEGMTGYDVFGTGGLLYKVSDSTPTIDDFANGFTLGVSSGEEFTFDDALTLTYDEAANAIAGVDLLFLVVGHDQETSSGETMEAGTYFVADIASLTISGYTGFTKEVLKKEALPEHSHKWDDISDRPFGDYSTGGDTLSWDGNTEGLASVDFMSNGSLYYKVSDSTPSFDDCANGIKLTGIDEGAKFEESASATALSETVFASSDYGIFVVTSDIYEGNVKVYAKGIYFAWYTETTYYFALTIPGYTGFPSVKKLEEKYLPGAVILYVGLSENDEYLLYNDAAVSERVTKSQLFNCFENGRVLLDVSALGVVGKLSIVGVREEENYALGYVLMEGAGVMRIYTAEYTAT